MPEEQGLPAGEKRSAVMNLRAVEEAAFNMDIQEICSWDLVLCNGQLCGVWDADPEAGSAHLLPLDAVIRYEGDEEAAEREATAVPCRQIERLAPAEADAETVRALFRLDVTPWELAKQGRYPFSAATHRCAITDEDLLCLIDRLPRFRNGFLLEGWRNTFQSTGAHDHLQIPPLTEEGLLLRFLAGRLLFLMSCLDACSEAASQWILPLRDAYLQSRGKPFWEVELPDDFKTDALNVIEALAQRSGISEPLRGFYTRLLEERFRSGGLYGIRRYAYAYYGGNGIVPCDWKKAEQALLRLFNPDDDPPRGDDLAANSLGYIYYSSRLGAPDCERAFRCFSFAALHGVIEAIYKLSDMYRKGDGTPRNPMMAWLLLSKLWKHTDKRRISQGKYADIALRMGYCYRDGIGVEADPAEALAFFRKARRGINARRKYHNFGDETVAANIDKAIASVASAEERP